jgi:excisionase family DNA binding protein
MNKHQFLLLPEVADRLRVSVKTVRRRIASGALRAFKEGGRLCVAEEEVTRYLTRIIEKGAAA